jgi:hypothetical protein
MARKRGLRFLARDGRELTVRDEEGEEHRATLRKVEAFGAHEDGAFAFGYCKSCDWTGPARRARDKARKDALVHQDDCTGKGRIRIGVSEDDTP